MRRAWKSWLGPIVIGLAWGLFGERLVGKIWALVITVTVCGAVWVWVWRLRRELVRKKIESECRLAEAKANLAAAQGRLALAKERYARVSQWKNAPWQ